MHARTRMVSYGARFATTKGMRKLLILMLAVGCGGGTGGLSNANSTPRPSPTQGGFQAEATPVVASWVNLGSPAPTTQSQQTLQLDGQGGPVSQLLVKGVSGEPEIDLIQIEYMDKSLKGVELHKRFVPGDGQVIELKENRPIRKIIVFIDPDSQGTVEIFGG